MNRVHPIKMSAIVFVFILLAAIPAIADQLVTPEHKKWAGQAVQQEKALSALTKPDSVAVLYFRNMSEDRSLDPLQKGLAVMLISDLDKLDMVTVVERAEIQALVEELGFGQTGLVDPATAPRVGRLLQSQHLIGGAISGSAKTEVTAGARLIDVGPGKTIGSANATDKIEQLFKLEKKILDQIVAKLQLNLTEEQKRALAKPLSRNHDALMDLFRGIDAADHQQFETATQFLDRALQRDPELTLARTTRQEISKAFDTKRRRILLRKMRKRVSLSTSLEPATPVARIPLPEGAPSRVEQEETIQEEPPQDPTNEEPINEEPNQPPVGSLD